MTATAAPRIWTLREVLQWTRERFAPTSASPRLDAELLLGYALGVARIHLYLDYDKPLSGAELASFRELVRRRLQGEPIAYITGQREFWSLPLQVSPAVLIPRPETELMVETALQLGAAAGAEPGARPRIVDVGTGSGAIAIALAREFGVEVMAVDRSSAALEVARRNALRNEVSLNCVCGDLLEAVIDSPCFDLVTANLPYVTTGEWAALPADVRDWEPRLALDGGPDGLDPIRRLLPMAQRRLRFGGRLLLEIAPTQAATVVALARAAGFQTTTVFKDLAGHDRLVAARHGQDLAQP